VSYLLAAHRQLARQQGGITPKIELGILQVRLIMRPVGDRLVERRLIGARIDAVEETTWRPPISD
jgi:hypothetical protein